MSGEEYRPIACALHDELLALATHRVAGTVRWQDEDGTCHEERTTIDDVLTRGKEEFARLGNGTTVRLDRLTAVEGTRIGDQ